MPNLCPVCQTPIRKNAKYCLLHGISKTLDNLDTKIVQSAHTKRTTKERLEHEKKVEKARKLYRLRPKHTRDKECAF